MRYQFAMGVLLLGATGLIGSAIAARLRRDGVSVTAVARGGGAVLRGLGIARVVRLDLRAATRPEDWRSALDGVDAVVNAAGVLQEGGSAVWRVHRDAPAALYRACAEAGIRRVVHISAIGADADARSDFSRSKHALEQHLAASDLDWVILRPAVVVGRAAYGGSALFRGLAALPILPVPAGTAPVQLVQLDEVAETVARLLAPDAPAQISLDLAAPEPLTFAEVVARYRVWLGWPPAPTFGPPDWLMGLMWRLGDLAGRLGWRPPVRTTARRELERGTFGDPAEWIRLTGIVPRSLDAALAAEPASVQERWFARLYLLKPALLIAFGLFWIVTGLVALGPGLAGAEALMREAGAGSLARAGAIAGALADLAIGALVLVRRTSRAALLAAVGVSFAYLVGSALLLPGLWADPLGPMVKIVPILALNFALLALLDDR